MKNDNAMETLKAGDKLYVQGTNWPNQYVGTIKAFNAKYGPPSEGHDWGDYAWLSAEAVVIDGRKPEPRLPVRVGQKVRIEGYGVYIIQRPVSGDSCTLQPVELEKGITTQEKADELRVKTIGHPVYDNT